MKLGNFSFFTKIGLDLGTSTIRIWHEDLGVIIDEPNCIAIDERVNKVVAVGKEASVMTGRVSKHIKVYYPFEHGLVSQIDQAKSLLQVFLQRALPHSFFFRPIVMASVPSLATELDRQVLTDLLLQVGAREVYLIVQPLAAAIGADVPVADASGSLVLHLGAGVVEGGMISYGNCVATNSTTKAGNYFDHQIKREVNQQKKINISLDTAKLLKQAIISLDNDDKEKYISGQDILTLAPREMLIKSNQLQAVTEKMAGHYAQLMRQLLAQVPPELTSDVIDKGILLTGAMAEIDGLDQYLVEQMGVPVAVVENSSQVVIKGIATVLEHLDLFKESLGFED